MDRGRSPTEQLLSCIIFPHPILRTVKEIQEKLILSAIPASLQARPATSTSTVVGSAEQSQPLGTR